MPRLRTGHFATSAGRDGGVRHFRWVTDSSGALSVLHVVLSPTGDDSLGNTRAELFTQGLGRTDRKYVVWTDAALYCGIAYVVGDARPDESNPANSGPTFARVDTACCGYSGSVEAHQIAHMLGAVAGHALEPGQLAVPGVEPSGDHHVHLAVRRDGTGPAGRAGRRPAAAPQQSPPKVVLTVARLVR